MSRSRYYAFEKRREEREREAAAMRARIKKIFKKSDSTYSHDRICGILRKKGQKASYRKISRYMSEMGLSSIHNRHKTRSLTDSRKSRGEGFPNLVKGNVFELPLQAVCSDITYLKSGEGWLYLCAVKDIVSGEILGEASSDRLKKELVLRAFLNAQARHNLTKETIFHSDHGSQYTSKLFMDTLKQYGIRQSFSRVGMPGDNARAESFFATLKKECIHFRQFATCEDLRQTVFAWIEGFYNTFRVQAKLGYMAPREYARLLLADGKAA